MNLLGDILNAVDNFEYQEDYGFIGSIFKIAPTVIDDYIKKEFGEYTTRIFEIPEKHREYWQKYDERDRINIIGENVSDEWNQIYKNDEGISTHGIEVLKVGTLCSMRDIKNMGK